jgi:uncharacterized membrane protein YjfL (UPF0719 family)
MGTWLVSLTVLVAAIILAALAAYLGGWLYQRSTRGVDEWKAIREGNAAVGITMGAVIVGLAIVMRPALAGTLPPLSGRLAADLPAAVATAFALALVLLRSVIAVILGSVGIWFAVKLFSRLTRDVDEAAELARGNVAVAVMMGAVILGVSLLLAPVSDVIADAIATVVFH